MGNASPIGMEIGGLSPVGMDFRGPGRAARMPTPGQNSFIASHIISFEYSRLATQKPSVGGRVLGIGKGVEVTSAKGTLLKPYTF